MIIEHNGERIEIPKKYQPFGFVKSIITQHENGKKLTDKQISTLKGVIGIPEYFVLWEYVNDTKVELLKNYGEEYCDCFSKSINKIKKDKFRKLSNRNAAIKLTQELMICVLNKERNKAYTKLKQLEDTQNASIYYW